MTVVRGHTYCKSEKIIIYTDTINMLNFLVHLYTYIAKVVIKYDNTLDFTESKVSLQDSMA